MQVVHPAQKGIKVRKLIVPVAGTLPLIIRAAGGCGVRPQRQ
ncbi:MAG: hypothetical protein JWR58_5410 [Pseudonocardia sp.]|jgi:hypothetical protein|nr:hypothetical protein [Pseudonocardia sp.]